MKINVLYTSDDNYAPYMGVSIYSLLKNNLDIDFVTIYVVLDNVSNDNIEKLKRLVASFGPGRELVIIDAQKYVKLFDDMGIIKYRGGHAASLRLLFTEYIRDDVEKILYLDCDTIISGSLSYLFLAGLDGKAVGVVIDSVSDKYKLKIGMKIEDYYFNSGVILFDVKKWKESHYDKRLLEYMDNQEYKFPNPDQDYLNLLMLEDKHILDLKYNFQPFHKAYSNEIYFSCFSKEGYYSSEDIDTAREKVVIYHMFRFLGQFPWYEDNIHPNSDLFWLFAKETEWNNMALKKNDSILFSLERIMYCKLPKILFLKIYRFAMKIYWSKKFITTKKGKN